MKLSVIIPTYNQQNLIKIGLESIPPRKDIEIIIIDDGSTDGTLNEVRNYQLNSDKNIIILHNDSNKGVAYSINRGLDISTGEYVVLLGSDGDYFVNLENGMNYLDGTDLVYFPLQINSGTFWHNIEGSCKFMRREFIGDLRVPLLLNCEDNEFLKLLMKKNPTQSILYESIMYKHYNYPRENSLSWRADHYIDEKGKQL